MLPSVINAPPLLDGARPGRGVAGLEAIDDYDLLVVVVGARAIDGDHERSTVGPFRDPYVLTCRRLADRAVGREKTDVVGWSIG